MLPDLLRVEQLVRVQMLDDLERRLLQPSQDFLALLPFDLELVLSRLDLVLLGQESNTAVAGVVVLFFFFG